MVTLSHERVMFVLDLVRGSARGLSTEAITREASQALGLSSWTVERGLVPGIARMGLIHTVRVGSTAVWMVPEEAQAWREGRAERERVAQRQRNVRKQDRARERRVQACGLVYVADGPMVQRVVRASATSRPRTSAPRSVFEWTGA